ncbi:MAG: lipid A deacylase LpxR family protein, partial [Maribacter sp.]|nr:lipid A deacylase LpxR family protein [Maribacter sp.]
DIQLKNEGYTSTKKVILTREVEQDSVSFDRPYAGVLFGELGANYTFTHSFVKANLLLGIMGPSSFARKLQDWIHESITEGEALEGWEFQIPDQFVFNLSLSGTYDLTPESNGFDVFAMGQLRAGNLVIDAQPLVGIRLGKFGPLTTSSTFGNGVLASKLISEFYLRSTVSAAFTLFNGTAQGNLFDRDFEYAVDDFSQFHTAMSHGIFFRKKGYSLGLDHVFSFGKSVKGSRHIYGRIYLEYTF